MNDIERLTNVINYSKLSPNAFSKSLGYNRSDKIQHILRGRNKISENIARDITTYYNNISYNWLLTGEGNMLLNIDEEISDKKNIKYRLIPVYNLDAVGGRINEQVDIQEFKTGEMPFADAQEGDICIPISGDSMFPTYKPTTYVQLRKVLNWQEYTETGIIYVLVLNDGRRIVKEIRNSKIDKKNFFLLYSHNPNYEEQEIPKSMISSLWIVVSRYTRDVM